MTIMSIDIETYEKRKNGLLYPVLNCQRFTIGALKKQGQKRTEFFYNKRDMWKALKREAKRAYNREKVAYVYGHNVVYDVYGIVDWEDRDFKIYSHSPFIATISHNGKESLKILDSMCIWPKSLKKVGEMLGYEKLEMPEYVGSPIELRKYLERDVEVCLMSILKVKEMLKENGIKTRRIYTIGQIAMNTILTEFKKEENTSKEFRESFFADEKSNTVWKSHHPEKVRNAYRGATEHAVPGKWKEVDCYDYNGLYQDCAEKMRFPKLNSESLVERPLQKMEKEDILSKIGISRCIVRNESCEHGLLQIRTPKSAYIPKVGKTLIGTWTNKELETAEKEGYRVLDIEWSLVYEETENPYKKVIPKLNANKENAKTGMERDYWKGIANHGFGKWGQRKIGKEIIIDSIEETKKYKERNFKMTHGIPGTYMMIYKKDKGDADETKSYYAPIIPTQINAEARLEMFKHIKKLKYEEWLYTGCDSIITTNTQFHKELDIGGKTGQFKTVYWKTPIEIIAKKHYKIGKEVKAAGIRRTEINEGDFEKRELNNKKMMTIVNTGNIKDVGKFKQEKRDLNEVLERYKEHENELSAEEIYIDSDIEDINYFLGKGLLWEEEGEQASTKAL